MNTTSMKISVVNQSQNPLPKYAHEPIDGKVQDSGMDIYADFTKINEKFNFGCTLNKDEQGNIVSITMHSLDRILIPTGIHVATPLGYEIQVRDRSGYALKKGIIVTNGIGTIDAIYRGDIGVVLTNCSREDVVIEAGEKIAQLVCCKVKAVEWELTDTLDETVRGEGGYNSTGIK